MTLAHVCCRVTFGQLCTVATNADPQVIPTEHNNFAIIQTLLIVTRVMSCTDRRQEVFVLLNSDCK